MGQERWKYMDMANMAFAAGTPQGYISCEGYIKAFIETVTEDTPEGNDIKTEFDRIEKEKNEHYKELEEATKDLGYLEQRDMRNNGKDQIEINAIYDMKTVCWTNSLRYGLFNA